MKFIILADIQNISQAKKIFQQFYMSDISSILVTKIKITQLDGDVQKGSVITEVENKIIK